MNDKFVILLNSERPWWKDPLFMGALGVALVTHATILSIHFGMPSASNASNKDTVISLNLNTQKVKEADFLAQADQQGDGESEEILRKSSITPLPMPEQSTGETEVNTLERLQQQKELNFEDKVLMTVLSWQKQAEEKQRKKAQESFESQYQAKAAMIASLEAQYSQRQQDLTRQQQIKTVSGVQAKQDATAPYLEKFRQKVELYGNQYYPEQAKLQQLSGEVRLMVILNPQGGIRNIQLIESSGHDVLDKAAINSVKKSAPFGVFEESMKKEKISELRIIRTWKFDSSDAEIQVNAR